MELLRIGIYGVSGSGKTTLVKQFSEKFDNFIYFETSEMLMDIIQKGIKKFKKLPSHEKIRIREESIRFFWSQQTKKQKHIITDGHFSYPLHDRFKHIVTPADQNFYTHIFYIDLPAHEIKKRYFSDTKKKRYFSRKVIQNWLNFEKENLQKMFPKTEIIHLKSFKTSSNIETIKEHLNLI
jgi:adenylate kinase